MKRLFNEQTLLSLVVLAMAGISPNIYEAAEAGYSGMPFLAKWVLSPGIVIIFIVFVVANLRGHKRLVNRMLSGATAGLIATVGLEIVREFGFHMGWMPGDMPKLFGVLITNRFMLGPDTWSNIIGYAYHFWNGISFGMIFTLVVGKKPFWWGTIYAILIGTVFLLSPAVQAMGIGFMGSGLPGMIETVYAAHLVYGSVLGFLSCKWVREEAWIFGGNRKIVNHSV